MTATVVKVPCYCVVLLFIVVTSTVDIVQWYCVVLVFIVVTATVYIVQRSWDVWSFCGESKSRYSTMVLCFVWSLLW